jgi:hypothetical protein
MADVSRPDPIERPEPPIAFEPLRLHLSVLLVGWGWTWEQMRDGAQEIEALGFDAIYIGDDLFPHPDVDTTVFDPWTVLPALAVSTSHVRLGSLVSPVGRRHPGLFAKITSGTDEISGGRLIVGMGAGNMPEQQASLDQPFAGPDERRAAARTIGRRSSWRRRARSTWHLSPANSPTGSTSWGTMTNGSRPSSPRSGTMRSRSAATPTASCSDASRRSS